jgi:hypothetical protein
VNTPLTTTDACQIHPAHRPESHLNDRHHVWPLGAGGPDIPENLVVVCATGHHNIHHLLNQYLSSRGTLPYSLTRTYTRQERRLAQLGYDRITRGAM